MRQHFLVGRYVSFHAAPQFSYHDSKNCPEYPSLGARCQQEKRHTLI